MESLRIDGRSVRPLIGDPEHHRAPNAGLVEERSQMEEALARQRTRQDSSKRKLAELLEGLTNAIKESKGGRLNELLDAFESRGAGGERT